MSSVIAQEFDPAIPIDSITEHPDNPRRGDDDAVTESIEANKFFGGILVQRSTGLILAGNTRWRSMRSSGADAIPGFWIDCDDETARRILLADNRVSDLAYYDDADLVRLLQEVHDASGDLLGTGYDDSSYELLLQSQAANEIMGGVRQGMTPGDRVDSYEAADIRSIILPLAGDEYDVLVTNLAELRERFDMPSNVEVVQHLVARAVDEVTPDDVEG